MRKLVLLILAASLVGGCSLITPQSVAITAGKYVAKKVVNHVKNSSDDKQESDEPSAD